MNLLNKLTIKNLKLNKKRTIVTIIGIILSCALIMAVATMYSSLIASMIKFEIKEKGNYHVAFYDVAKADLAYFQNNRQVTQIYKTTDLGYAYQEKIKNESKPYVRLKGFDKDSLNNLAVNLVEGRLPQNEHEVVIPTHLKTNGRMELKVGEEITLDLGKRYSAEGQEMNQNLAFTPGETIQKSKQETFKIVGIISRPPTSVEEYSNPGYTFITYTDFKNSTHFNLYLVLTKSALKNYNDFIANMANLNYQVGANTYLIALETNPLKDSSIGSLGAMVAIVCGIIIVTSVFCIKNSFDISITEKVKQYGMLRSIGATKKQIRQNVFYEATILGLIGIPLGIASGILASFILIIVSNFFLKDAININLIFNLNIWALIISIILSIITIYLSAFRSARRAAKVSPIESIRNSANIKIKSQKLKSSKLINKFFGIGGDISYKNLKRNKKKYRTTVISIIVSVAVFIALASFMNLAFASVKLELSDMIYNLQVRMEYTDEAREKFAEITSLDNINDYTIERNMSFVITNPQYNPQYVTKSGQDPKDQDYFDGYINIVALGDYQYQKYLKSLGLKADENKDMGILIDKITLTTYEDKGEAQNYHLREYNYQKGDVIVDNTEENPIALTIAAVTDKAPNLLFSNNYNSYIIISDATFDKYYEPGSATLYLDATKPTQIQDKIETILGDTEYYLNNSAENAEMMRNLFTLIGIFLYGFIIVISLIGITNIFNTITTNMELRKGEFAMLKSIGMTKKEFNRMIRLESIFMGLKSLLIGIPVGLGLSLIIYRALNGKEYYSLPVLAIIISIIAVYLLITVIMQYSLHKISKQNTIETIRNENI